ncbi:MAG: DoxX family membrane protein [Polyangiaceae bacterium]|nr:DoxX family membrane protein [Polyangiaceae bacterium]
MSRASRCSTFVEWRGHAYISLAMRLYLGWVFIAACLHKIANPASFAVDVATYQFLPLWAVNFFALTLPWVELFAGVLLVLGLRARAAALLIAVMMASFMVALGHALYLGLDMACGCFASAAAVDEDPISWHTVVRDAGWLSLALYVLCLDRAPLGLDRWSPRKGAKSSCVA